MAQGERSITAPLVYAEKLKQSLANAKGGAILYPIKGIGPPSAPMILYDNGWTENRMTALCLCVVGATACLTLIESTATIVNQVYFKFLSTLPPARSDLILPPNIEARMRRALEKLANISGNMSIAERDPASSLSFSCVTQEVATSPQQQPQQEPPPIPLASKPRFHKPEST